MGGKRDSDTRRGVRLLRPYVKQQRKPFIAACLMLAFEAGTAVLQAVPLAYLIDYLTDKEPDLPTRFGMAVVFSPLVDTIAVLTLGILLLAMVNSAADSMAEIYLAKGGRRLGFRLRVGLYGHLQRLSLAYHSRRRTGDVVTRLTGDVITLEDFVTKSASDLVGSVFVLAGTLAALLTKSWQVALLAAVVVPLVSVVSHYFSVRIKKVAKRQRAREGDLASAAQEMLTSIRVIQTYGRGVREEQRFTQQSSATLDAALEGARLQAWFSWVVKVLEAVTTGAVVWLGVWLVGLGTLTAGTLILLIYWIDAMFKPSRRIIKEWATIGKLLASLERIGEVFDRKPTVFDVEGAVPAPPLRGAIEFRDVSFAYRPDPIDGSPEEPDMQEALTGINFRIAPGEVVALIGRSGAGKSTIAQLLPRLYDPDTGQVLIDGADVRQFTLASLRSQISMVLQDTVLFTGTVADNIAYGRPGASRAEIIAAAEQANAHEFITQLEDGYDTMLGERGDTLSGGQRQRLAIARALVRGAPILILDEPTTGLDAESTDLVLEALGTLMAGKSTLIISHDLNLVRHADEILVLEAGRIVQVGTHDDLIRQPGGLYAELHGRQFAALNGSPQPSRRRPSPARAEPVPAVGGSAVPGDGLATMATQELPAPFKVSEFEPLPQPLTQGVGGSPPSQGVGGSLPSQGVGGRPPMRPAVAEWGEPRRALGLQPLSRLPSWLEAAADPERVRGALARTVAEFGSGGMVLESCVPHQLQLKSERWVACYDARVSPAGGTPPGNGRVVSLAGALDPPQASNGAAEVRGSFGSPEWRCRLPELGLSLWTRPTDGALSALRLLMDPETCRVLFEDTMGLRIAACRPRVLQYKYGSRCTVLVGMAYPVGVTGPDTVVAKIYRGTSGGNAYRGMRALWDSRLASGDVVTIAEPLAYLPYLRLLVQRTIPEERTLEDLLRSVRGSGGTPPVTVRGSGGTPPVIATGGGDPGIDAELRQYLHQTAFGLAALHTCPLEYGLDVTFADEMAAVHERCARLAGPFPAVAKAVEPVLAQIEARAAACPPDPSGPAHRSFLPEHVLLWKGRIGFIAFGGMCRAEPAMDLARFCARVKTMDLGKLHGGPDALRQLARLRELEEFCELFVSSYTALAPLSRERFMLWEALYLLTAVLQCWTDVQPGRLDAALLTLTEHLRALGIEEL